jgi:hypothetical protein
MSNEWTPPGYVSVVSLVRKHGLDKVRSDLFSGRLDAFRWDGTAGHLWPIEPTLWCGDSAERLLEQGYTPHHNRERPACVIVVRVVADPQPPRDGAYVLPFMRLMHDAVQHFEISEASWPKKEELEAFFRAQKLSDGTTVSPNIAKQLATLCRPLAAQHGGNKKG